MSTSLVWTTLKVAAKTRAATDITTFELVHPEGAPLPPFDAGAHIDVEVAPGLVRQYSLCNDPRERHRYLIGVLRESQPSARGGSRRLVDQVNEGDPLRIGAPRNHFALDASAERVVLIAGGIGITPLLAMAEQLAHAGTPFELHYCSRSRTRVAFNDRLARADLASHVHLHIDDEGSRLDMAEALGAPGTHLHLYVCGPTPFIEAALETAASLGWAQENVHREFFVSTLETRRAEDATFEIELANSARRLTVLPNQSVLDVLTAAGVPIPTSCEQGVCGTCVTRVLSGTPDHRDLFLTDQEHAKNDQFTPCCSRSKSERLVLDL